MFAKITERPNEQTKTSKKKRNIGRKAQKKY